MSQHSQRKPWLTHIPNMVRVHTIFSLPILQLELGQAMCYVPRVKIKEIGFSDIVVEPGEECKHLAFSLDGEAAHSPRSCVSDSEIISPE